jgi:hypothetical protein
MTAVIETRREQAQLVLDVVDGFLDSRAAPRSRRVRPRTRVRARVLERVSAPAETFSPPWRLVTRTTPEGFLAWFGRVRPDSAGDADEDESDRAGVLEPGTYEVELAARGYQAATAQAVIPATGAPPSVLAVGLEAGPDYAFPNELAEAGPPAGRSTGPTLIRGQVLDLDGSGLAGVPVQAPGAVPAVTDRNGSWVLVFPDDRPSEDPVDVTATIGSAAVTAASKIVAGQRTVVPQARLRGRTVRQSGVPVAGAAISVSGIPGAVASGADGSWSLALPFGTGLQPINVTVTATLGPTTVTQAGVGVVPGTSVLVPDHTFPNP